MEPNRAAARAPCAKGPRTNAFNLDRKPDRPEGKPCPTNALYVKPSVPRKSQKHSPRSHGAHGEQPQQSQGVRTATESSSSLALLSLGYGGSSALPGGPPAPGGDALHLSCAAPKDRARSLSYLMSAQCLITHLVRFAARPTSPHREATKPARRGGEQRCPCHLSPGAYHLLLNAVQCRRPAVCLVSSLGPSDTSPLFGLYGHCLYHLALGTHPLLLNAVHAVFLSCRGASGRRRHLSVPPARQRCSRQVFDPP
jgi:hypothetical protein